MYKYWRQPRKPHGGSSELRVASSPNIQKSKFSISQCQSSNRISQLENESRSQIDAGHRSEHSGAPFSFGAMKYDQKNPMRNTFVFCYASPNYQGASVWRNLYVCGAPCSLLWLTVRCLYIRWPGDCATYNGRISRQTRPRGRRYAPAHGVQFGPIGSNAVHNVV